MSVKRMTLLAVLTAAALTIFIVEAQIPAFIAVPGVKLGLSNVITLAAAYLLSRRDAGIVLLMRIILGSMFAGGMAAFLYSAAGGVCAFAVVCVFYKVFDKKQLWAVSVLSAIAHNIAQLLVAAAVMNSSAVIWYAPWLIISAVLTGAFNGVAVQFAVKRLQKVIK